MCGGETQRERNDDAWLQSYVCMSFCVICSRLRTQFSTGVHVVACNLWLSSVSERLTWLKDVKLEFPIWGHWGPGPEESSLRLGLGVKEFALRVWNEVLVVESNVGIAAVVACSSALRRLPRKRCTGCQLAILKLLWYLHMFAYGLQILAKKQIDRIST